MPTLGNLRKVYLVDTSTYTWLAGEQSNNVNLNGNAIEVSDKETAWQKFIAGVRGGAVNVDVHLDDSASQPQHKMLRALAAGSIIKAFVGVLGDGSTPSEGIAFDALVTNISDSNPNGEVSSRSMTLTITGEPSFYPTA